MSLIKTVPVGQKDGPVGQVYEMFRQSTSMVPGPLRALSASAGLFAAYTSTFSYWRSHPNLSRDPLTCIRYAVATQHDFGACEEFNHTILTQAGMEQGELVSMQQDPRTAPLEEREVAWLRFVLRATQESESITQAQVDSLRELGWTEADLVDAVYHGAILQTMATIMKTFKA